MDDAFSGWNNADISERFLSPFKQLIAFLVAFVFLLLIDS